MYEKYDNNSILQVIAKMNWAKMYQLVYVNLIYSLESVGLSKFWVY